MQIELVGSRTMVVFLTQKQPSAFSRFADWIYGLFGAEKSEVKVKLASVIRPGEVTESDIEKWFAYLLSGLKRAFMPPASTPPTSSRFSRAGEACRGRGISPSQR
jgi:hypothetical protein